MVIKGLYSNCYTTAQKMKFSIKDFFSQCDQIHSFLKLQISLLRERKVNISYGTVGTISIV